MNPTVNKFPRIFYFLPVLVYCLFLCLRPIPGYFSDNDTGRYVVAFFEACRKDVSFDLSERITWESYNLLTLVLCPFDSAWVLMFFMAILLPIAFLFFDISSVGALLLYFAYCFSQIGFEFMTNAFRQNVSIFFLLLAFLYERKSMRSVIFAFVSLLLHDSAVTFIPVFFIIRYLGAGNIGRWKIFYLAAIILAVGTGAYFSYLNVYLADDVQSLDGLVDVFSVKYEYQQSIWFQLYVILPFAWIFFVQLFFSKAGVSRSDCILFFYSLSICVFTSVFFSYITYRFAMSAFVFQIANLLRARFVEEKVGRWALIGIVAHMGIYLMLSNNISGLLEGS